MTEHPYSFIQGTLPRKRDVSEWKEEKFLEFFKLVQFFMVGEMITITKEKCIELQNIIQDYHHPWAEMAYRINSFTYDKDYTTRNFYNRLTSTVRLVGMYLKQNPAAISEEMKKAIEPNPRLNWILKTYKTVETKVGIPITVPDTRETVGLTPHNTPAPKTPEVSLMESMLKTANVFDMIVGSIKKKDMEDMGIKDKINALSKLSFIWTAARNMKPQTAVFKQLNVYSAKKEDLEKSLLEFSQERDEETN